MLFRSDPKERVNARLLAVIGFPHAEHMAIRATRCVADDHHAIAKHSEANHPPFAVALACVFGLEERLLEYELGILEVQLPCCQRLCPLLWIVGDRHAVSVSTSTPERKHKVSVTPLKKLPQQS